MYYSLGYVVDGINQMDISREKTSQDISSDENGMDHAKSITK